MAIKWTDEIEGMLGTVPDQKIADKFGMSPASICERRKGLGIPSYGHNEGVQWTPKTDGLLGTRPDRKLARKLGLSRQTVMYRRQELGISSYRKRLRVLPEGLPSWSYEAARIYQQHRKHKEAGLVDTLTYDQWLFACRWFENRCAYCDQHAFLTEDHLVPVSKKGPRTVSNIVPACQSCNSSKRDRVAHLWIYEKFGVPEGREIVERIVAYLTEVSKEVE